MRLITLLGFVLLALGTVLVISSIGAFDSTAADRSAGIETATDENAYLGIVYDDQLVERTLELESNNADGGGGCIFYSCNEYEYDDRELVVFEDNVPEGELSTVDGEATIDDSNLTGGDELRVEYDQGIAVVRGDFRCPVDPVLLGSGEQRDPTTTATISLEASDGNATVELERDVEIDCVQE
ncbi:hypothetical protein ACT4ML_04605 [Natrinema sp. LN54]|uniref:hypothetical protein n=1 Tax=Natrinema sp. LN54 TaxID=3458705 RepID=UPI004035A2D3